MDTTTTKIIKEYLQYHFSDQELLQLTKERSRAVSEYRALENKKAQITKQMAGDIADKDNEVRALDERIGQGYEYRDVDCEVRFDQPKPGMCEIVRTDTGEIVRSRRMTEDEMQLKLRLDEEQPQEVDE